MHNFGVMIRRKGKEEEGCFPEVVTVKDLRTYRRDQDFIVKFGVTKSQALTIKNCIQEGLIDMHIGTRIDMKDLVDRIFFGGE